MPDDLSWLALLVEDAPAERLEAYRIASHAQTADGGARDTIDAEARRALHVRALLSERRQRTAELGTLLDLTRRLSAFRDVDALLQEIVTQARRLLSVDVAYLALVEPEALRIRVNDGATGDGLRGLELSPRKGIAGRVAETGEPYRTADYINDPSFEHTESIDNVAQREGMLAIAGVPLRVGDKVTGVLFASDRTQREFTDAEISLLSSLGAHAAIALENARLFQELSEQHESQQRAVALHERLTGVVLRGGSTDDVLHALEEVVPGTMQLIAPGDEEPIDPARHRTVVPVTAADDQLGVLVAHTDEPPSAAALRLLERSALTLALVLLSDRAVVEAQSRARNELLAALLSSSPSADVEARLRAIGVDLRQPHCVAVIEPANDARSARDRLHAATLVGDHDGIVVALLAGDDAGHVVNDLTKVFDRSGATVAVHGPAVGVAAVAESYREARRGVRLLAALGRTQSVATVDELGPYRYLFGRAGADDAQRFVDHAIGVLIAHDAAKHSDLVGTLELYLDNAQQHAASAAALGIHANTLYQRLGRIAELLGENWRLRALELHLAVRLHRLGEKVGDPSIDLA